MDRLGWCLKQEKGIRLIAPNKNLSNSYLERAKSDLKNINKQDPVWKIIVSYYACYNAFYAVLSRFEVRSEIHSCTIHLLSCFERLNNYEHFMEDLKENRTDTQYYLKSPSPVNVETINEFITFCELEIGECNQKKIDLLMSKLNETIA